LLALLHHDPNRPLPRLQLEVAATWCLCPFQHLEMPGLQPLAVFISWMLGTMKQRSNNVKDLKLGELVDQQTSAH